MVLDVSPTPLVPTQVSLGVPPTPTGGGLGVIAFSSFRAGESEIFLVNADGSNVVQLTEDVERLSRPAWSPDGKRIVYVRREGQYNHDLFIMNVDGSGVYRLTTDGFAMETEPAWSPGGKRIAFVSNQRSFYGASLFDIFLVAVDGSVSLRLTDSYESAVSAQESNPDGEASGIDLPSVWNTSPSWSPDGRKIVFRSNRDGNNEIYVMNTDGSGQINLTEHQASDTDPAWSPDGTKIAFVSDRSGDEEIYVMELDGRKITQLTQSLDKDTYPSWSPDGRLIAFYSRREGNFELFVMKADGSEPMRLTNHGDFDGFPAWQPNGSAAQQFAEESVSAEQPESKEIDLETRAWLAAETWPLTTIKPGDLYNDLSAFRDFVEDRRIVDFGGSLSGSHEVLTLKHRLIRFFIEELNFTHIIMEIGWVDGYLIDQYVRGINKDGLEAQRALIRSGSNYREVWEMLAWMRSHNQNIDHESQVRVYGVGGQDPVVAMDLVVSFFEKVDPEDALKVKGFYSCLRSYQDNWVRYGVASPDPVRRCRQNVQQVEASLRVNSQDYVSRSTIEDYEVAIHGASLVTWSEKKLASLLFDELNSYRDEDIQWVLEHMDEDAKMIIWAPNIEKKISDSGPTFVFNPDLSAYLGEVMEETPFILGFSFGEGEITAVNSRAVEKSVEVLSVPPPIPDSIEWCLYFAQWPTLILPMGATGVNYPHWMDRTIAMRLIPGAYDSVLPGDFFVKLHLPSQFDALVFVQKSNPAQLIQEP
jgi:erythromycin esterase-like protein